MHADRSGVRRGIWVWVVVAMLLSGTAVARAQQQDQGDRTPPRIVGFAITPGRADVTTANATFEVRLEAVDDRSAVDMAFVGIFDGSQAYLTRIEEGPLTGVWQGTLTVPRGADPGRHPLIVALRDRVGNEAGFDSGALAAAGWPSGLDIVNTNHDPDPPVVTRLEVSPQAVDATEQDQTVTVEFEVRDPSGISSAGAALRTSDGIDAALDPTVHERVSVDATSATYRVVLPIPQRYPSGSWTVGLTATDQVGNFMILDGDDLAALGLPHTVEVASDGDTDPPLITELSITPSFLDVSETDQTMTIRVRVTDKVGVPLAPEEGNVSYHVNAQIRCTQVHEPGGSRRIEGDEHDGVYVMTIVVPKASGTGTCIPYVMARDAIGHQIDLFEPPHFTPYGAPGSIIAFTATMPPANFVALPRDGAVELRWSAPLDDGGEPILGYSIQESSVGMFMDVGPDQRSLVIDKLLNGHDYWFNIAAYNKDGLSDYAGSIKVTPRAAAVAARRSGYLMLGAKGDVYPFGETRWLGQPAPADQAVDIETTPSGKGYHVVDAAGRVSAHGDASHRGHLPILQPGETVTSLSRTPTGRGYWLFTSRGRAFPYGDAPFLGDMSATALNGPVLDSIPTPSGLGYFMVASDGGIFAFGDATFRGSMGSVPLNAPVQSLVPTPSGAGYWLVASDGGVFAFGDAPFRGSTGNLRLNEPVTGMVGIGGGYLMVAEDGGIFAFDAPFLGSLGSSPPDAPVVAVSSIR